MRARARATTRSTTGTATARTRNRRRADAQTASLAFGSSAERRRVAGRLDPVVDHAVVGLVRVVRAAPVDDAVADVLDALAGAARGLFLELPDVLGRVLDQDELVSDLGLVRAGDLEVGDDAVEDVPQRLDLQQLVVDAVQLDDVL